MQKVRWGILGPGNIANLFADGLTAVEDAELIAVGSRDQAKANAFADKWKVPHRHSSYEALVNDPDVEIIYIATPHPFHYEHALLCLNSGKHAIVEKPFALNARQAREMIDLARQKRLFLMEAMWTRFIPAIAQVRKWIADGEIGDVELVRANLSFNAAFNPKSRLFAPELAGGALLDVGIYPVSFANMIYGTPKTISSTACLGPTGTDDRSSYLFGYDGGKSALLSSAVRLSVPVEADVIGTKGHIKIHEPWINSRVLTLAKPAVDIKYWMIFTGHPYDKQTVYVPTTGNGYNYEAIEAGQCIRAGKKESDILPLSETLSIMETMDTIRGQWGLKYPGE
jgi:predicted dehydrogenase